jgi:hypothetical protein
MAIAKDLRWLCEKIVDVVWSGEFIHATAGQVIYVFGPYI